MDLQEIGEQVQKSIQKLGLVDKLLSFANLARSPDPDDLVEADQGATCRPGCRRYHRAAAR
jgi:hypothetical protein